MLVKPWNSENPKTLQALRRKLKMFTAADSSTVLLRRRALTLHKTAELSLNTSSSSCPHLAVLVTKGWSSCHVPCFPSSVPVCFICSHSDADPPGGLWGATAVPGGVRCVSVLFARVRSSQHVRLVLRCVTLVLGPCASHDGTTGTTAYRGPAACLS